MKTNPCGEKLVNATGQFSKSELKLQAVILAAKSMSARILTVTLNPAVDKTLLVKNPCVGNARNVLETLKSAGGKGLNVSRVLNRLRVTNIATGFLGGANGQWIAQRLRQENIHAEFVNISGETRTNLTVRVAGSDQMERYLEDGPIVSAKERKAFEKKYISLLRKVDVVILSGRLVPGVNDSFYFDLIQIGQRYGEKVALDTSGAPLLAGLKAKPFFIKPNLEEAEFIFKRPLLSVSDVKNAVLDLSHRGLPQVVISMGDKGVVAASQDECLHVKPSVRGKLHNDVGCGDAFVAGFMAGFIQKKSFIERTKVGVAAAISNSRTLQPGEVNLIQVNRLVKQLSVRKFS